MERDYVANYYGPKAIFWMERVAGMPTDQVTAIYLRFQQNTPPPSNRDKPLPLKTEKLEKPDDDDLRLF